MSNHRPIPNTCEIKGFLHCKLCAKEKPLHVSMRDFAQLEVGFTEIGWQVWCIRHDCNVVHIDFQGHQHPANQTRAASEAEKVIN